MKKTLVAIAFLASFGVAHAQPKTSSVGPCDLSVLGGTSIKNFNTLVAAVKQCGAVDAQTAWDDAKAQVPMDYIAIGCLSLLTPILQAIASTDGNSGAITAFQKFRDFTRSGGVSACKAYVTDTLSPFK